MEKVHIHTINIVYRNQVLNFFIYLPGNVKEITGIYATENTGITNDTRISTQKYNTLQDNIQIGRLALKKRGKPETFFGTDVIRNDNSLRYGDFSQLNFYEIPESQLQDFIQADWPQAGSRWDAFPCEINPASHVLLGYYKDKLLSQTQQFQSGAYSVSIYLKYTIKTLETCEPK